MGDKPEFGPSPLQKAMGVHLDITAHTKCFEAQMVAIGKGLGIPEHVLKPDVRDYWRGMGSAFNPIPN